MNSDHLMNNYGQRQHTLIKGEGCYLYDQDGQAYLDALTGIAVCGLGHNHPAVTKAICQQAQTLLHISNLFNIESQQALSEKLCRASGLDRAYFCNSGAEANETAIKIARKYGHKQGIDRPQILVTNRSFHGRTMATLSATGNPKIQQGFAPLLDGFIHVDYDDAEAMATALKDNPNIVAILVEPVQGESGVRIPAADYLNKLRILCDQHHCLLMLDEVQTGNGRTGRYFAFQHNGILPDVLTTAKGLGNGVPIGACLARGAAAEQLQAGTHGSTYGGNPLVCRAAEAVTDTLSDGKLIARAEALGNSISNGIQAGLEGHWALVQVRAKGLMIGIELNQDCTELVEAAWQHKLLINVAGGNTIRLLPPLILSDEQAQVIITTVIALVHSISRKSGG